jgi:hypothetical protein
MCGPAPDRVKRLLGRTQLSRSGYAAQCALEDKTPAQSPPVQLRR